MSDIIEKKHSLPFGLWVILVFAGLQGILLLFELLVSFAQFNVLNSIFVIIYLWILWSGMKLCWFRQGKGIERLFLLYTLNVINIAFGFIDGFSLKNDWFSLLLLALNVAVLFHLNFLRVFFLDLKLTDSEKKRDSWSGAGLILLALLLPAGMIWQTLPEVSSTIAAVSQCSVFNGTGREICIGVSVFEKENVTSDFCETVPEQLRRDCILTLALQSSNESACANTTEPVLCKALSTKNSSLCDVTAVDVQEYCREKVAEK